MFLSKKDIKILNEEISSTFNVELLHKKDSVERKDYVLYKDKEVMFFYLKGVREGEKETLIPHLKLLQKENFLPSIVVDMPAVPFMIKGADVMRPGIIEIGEFSKGDLVSVVDETNKKAIAVGIALLDSKEMEQEKTGKMIKNLQGSYKQP